MSSSSSSGGATSCSATGWVSSTARLDGACDAPARWRRVSERDVERCSVGSGLGGLGLGGDGLGRSAAGPDAPARTPPRVLSRRAGADVRSGAAQDSRAAARRARPRAARWRLELGLDAGAQPEEATDGHGQGHDERPRHEDPEGGEQPRRRPSRRGRRARRSRGRHGPGRMERRRRGVGRLDDTQPARSERPARDVGLGALDGHLGPHGSGRAHGVGAGGLTPVVDGGKRGAPLRAPASSRRTRRRTGSWRGARADGPSTGRNRQPRSR